jgi:glycosyltransferase involved in cell wall biosynthesis
MKLALYLRHFPAVGAPLVGGTEKAVHGLAAGLAASGARVTVLCEGTASSTTATNHGYVVRCFARPWPQRPFGVSRQLKRYLAVESFGLVVLNGLFTPNVYSLARVLARARKPYVFAPHGVYQPELFRRNPHLKLPYWTLFERRVLQGASAIQVQDSRQVHWLRARGVPNPVVAVPSGMFADDVPADIASRWTHDRGPAFLYFGRIDVYGKGLDLLLEAFAQVAAQAGATLTIQGPGSREQHALHRLVEKFGLADRVSVLGPDYETPGPLRMSQYDVVCIPSRWDSFSLSGLEAMMAARVILISHAAGLAPHVAAAECGTLVSAEAAAIASGFRELLDRRAQWQEMGLRGRQYVLDHLEWRQLGAAALSHYRRLVP